MSAQAVLDTLQSLTSPGGKRKRNRVTKILPFYFFFCNLLILTKEIEETIHEEKVRSPNKQRLMTDNTTQKIYSPSSCVEDKENGTPSKMNSPPSIRKRSLRLKDLSEKLRKRSSLGILSPKRQAPAAPTPTTITAPITTASEQTPTTPKADKPADVGRITPSDKMARSNLSKSHSEQKRTPLPSAIKKKHLDMLRSPNHKKCESKIAEVSSPKSPGLSRSISLYNLPKPALPDESPTNNKAPFPSPRVSKNNI